MCNSNFPRILEVVIFFIDFFHVYFSNSDISTTVQDMSLKCFVWKLKVLAEGTVSQIFY